MAKERASFPLRIWNGLSRNSQRTSVLDEIEPNPEDWSKMVSEVIQTQVFIASTTERILQRFFETQPLARDERTGGLILSSPGIRNIAVSGGVLWERLDRNTLSAIDTSASGSFSTFHSDGVGGFIQTVGFTQWPNTDFDDGSGILATLGKKKLGVLWFYVTVDNNLIMIYGTEEHGDLEAAQLESSPPNLPNEVQGSGRLISRLIFKKNSDVPNSITSAFAQI